MVEFLMSNSTKAARRNEVKKNVSNYVNRLMQFIDKLYFSDEPEILFPKDPDPVKKDNAAR